MSIGHALKHFCIVTLLSSICAIAQASDLDVVRKAFVEASACNYAPDDSVTARCIRFSEHGRANDVLLLQLYLSVHLPDNEIEELIASFDRKKGCWDDIDYAAQDRGRWPSTLHVTRMYALAKVYKAGNAKWKDSEELGSLLHQAMKWWFDNKPHCPNWWHNDIGVPKKMTAVLLMMRDELSQDEIAGGLKVLERSKFGRTGQNKVWLAANNLMKGMLTDDEALARKACGIMAEEIYITSAEGIQEDWSFHQHGAQNQLGNYGLAFAQDLAFWFRVLKGTEYDFDEGRKEIVANFVKNGLGECVWKGVMDPSYCGRQNFPDAGQGKGYALGITAINMAEAMPEYSKAFSNMALEIFQPETHDNTMLGGRYFHRSDCGVFRTASWYGSVRMHSERTIGFEFTNKENTLANFSADGAVMVMESGKEYENIFACWDWRKVPGVTAYEDGKPIKCDDSPAAKCNHSGHVFGQEGEDCMAATMELMRDSLHALKTVFFFEDCVLNLGCDIRSANPSFTGITTAVDQTLLETEVRSGKNWLHHGSRGYISVDGKELQYTAGPQSGKWDLIDPGYKDWNDEKEVFKCWFEHPTDRTDSYAYMILPQTDAKKTAKLAASIDKKGRKAVVRILRNDASCQAVLYKGKVSAVFHQPGTYTLGGRTFSVSEPSFVLQAGQNRP